MLKEKADAANGGIALGIILQGVGYYLKSRPDIVGDGATGKSIVGGLFLLGTLLFLFGCAQYALGKGQSGWFGLLGLLSIFGLVGLVCLPDKHPGGRKPVVPGDPPGEPGDLPDEIELER